MQFNSSGVTTYWLALQKIGLNGKVIEVQSISNDFTRC